MIYFDSLEARLQAMVNELYNKTFLAKTQKEAIAYADTKQMLSSELQKWQQHKDGHPQSYPLDSNALFDVRSSDCCYCGSALPEKQQAVVEYAVKALIATLNNKLPHDSNQTTKLAVSNTIAVCINVWSKQKVS